MRSNEQKLRKDHAALQGLAAQLSVKAKGDEARYKEFHNDCVKMTTKLAEFLVTVSTHLAEVQFLDESDVAATKALKTKIVAVNTSAEFHLAGAKGAKTRFQAMLA